MTITASCTAEHRRAPTGAGQTLRSTEHADALQTAVLAAFTTDHACRSKTNRPPGQQALAQLARLRGVAAPPLAPIDLADYQRLAEVGLLMSDSTVYQQLREQLHTLGLQAAVDALAPALEQAEREKPGYTRFLHDLLAVEVHAAQQRR